MTHEEWMEKLEALKDPPANEMDAVKAYLEVFNGYPAETPEEKREWQLMVIDAMREAGWPFPVFYKTSSGNLISEVIPEDEMRRQLTKLNSK